MVLGIDLVQTIATSTNLDAGISKMRRSKIETGGVMGGVEGGDMCLNLAISLRAISL